MTRLFKTESLTRGSTRKYPFHLLKNIGDSFIIKSSTKHSLQSSVWYFKKQIGLCKMKFTVEKLEDCFRVTRLN